MDGMAMLGYDVVNVGERELVGGIAQFRSLAEKSKLTLSNANFIYRDTGDQLFAPFVIREYKLASGRTVKVGFIGLDALNSAFAKETPEGRVIIMRDPLEAAKLHVPALRSRVDLVVLIANLSLRDLATVVSTVQGIDVALVSYGARLSEGGKLENISGVPVLYSGDQGKRMGEVRLNFGKKNERPVMTSNQVFLTKRYPSEAKLQLLVDKTISRVNEINKQTAERLASAGAGVPPTARPAAQAPAVGTPGVASKPYLTAAACESCHAKESEIYLGSAHSHAFSTLVKANQDFNPECVKCHVTGSDQPNGFSNARQTPDLANVQCEACHGNASDHVADPQKPFGRVAPRTCFTCHTKENSPDFVFYKYWDLIKH